MRLLTQSTHRLPYIAVVISLAAAVGVAAVAGCGSSSLISAGLPGGSATSDQVALGRSLVTSVGCTDCHSQGKDDPSSTTWLAGFVGAAGGQGPGAFVVQGFNTYAANLTPDKTTGLGNFTDQQVFNALRYGLDPAVTPSVTITGNTPGQGNYPANPQYLAPPMPWVSFRQMTDINLWAMVAYIKHGIKAVSNTVPPSQGPADHWVSFYTSTDGTTDKLGPITLPNYPASNEQYSP